MGDKKPAQTVVALYRKYRPASLDEVVGQSAITQSLGNALESKEINHAYLFTGPRGVGKTSVARIFAHSVNDLPYEPNQTNHLDIIEIDGASNRKVEEIENLREKIQLGPTSAKYKVYIIDEVHMLTTHAFNALLKTLEEPPAHAIFILATTEAHKLPDTIISRTQRYNFRPLGNDSLVSCMKNVAKREGIDVEDEALELLAEQAEGGMRDALSLLEQMSLHHRKKVKREDVMALFGLTDIQKLEKLTAAINEGQPKDLFVEINQQYELGVPANQLASQLAKHWRRQIAGGDYPAWMIQGITLMLDVIDSRHPDIKLEASLAMLLQPGGKKETSSEPNSKPKTTPNTSSPTKEPAEHKEDDSKAEAKTESSVKENRPKQKDPQKLQTFSLDNWLDLLQRIKANNPSLYAVLRVANPTFDETTLELSLAFGFELHKKKVSDAKAIDIIKTELENLGLDSSIAINCSIDKDRKQGKLQEKDAGRTEMIINVLGGEMVEV